MKKSLWVISILFILSSAFAENKVTVNGTITATTIVDVAKRTSYRHSIDCYPKSKGDDWAAEGLFGTTDVLSISASQSGEASFQKNTVNTTGAVSRTFALNSKIADQSAILTYTEAQTQKRRCI